MSEHMLRIADQATMLGDPSAGLLVITAAWTGCRWGELAGLHRDHVHLDRGVTVIDSEYGAPHESTHGLWLGPPKTPASARTITLPPFLIELLRDHLAASPRETAMASALGPGDHQVDRAAVGQRLSVAGQAGAGRLGHVVVG